MGRKADRSRPGGYEWHTSISCPVLLSFSAEYAAIGLFCGIQYSCCCGRPDCSAAAFWISNTAKKEKEAARMYHTQTAFLFAFLIGHSAGSLFMHICRPFFFPFLSNAPKKVCYLHPQRRSE